MVTWWFESYLSYRKQCEEINNVEIGTCVSATRELEHAVPQGIFFVIYFLLCTFCYLTTSLNKILILKHMSV
jgi:hypothetical protein